MRTCVEYVVLMFVLLATRAPAAEMTPPATTCPLCRSDLPVPVVSITAEWTDSVARDHARFNERRLAAIDSLWRAGTWGDPDDSESKQAAHLEARLTMINAYRDLVALACDSTHVHEIREPVLRALYSRYADVNLFIPARLVSVRMGLGRVCVRYNLDQITEGSSRLGGKVLRWRVADIEIYGEMRRVLDVTFPTGDDDKVRLMLASHHTFAVEYRRSPGPPVPFEWFIVSDVEGGWIRKWGTHRPTGYMFWVSEPAPATVTEPQCALPASVGGAEAPRATSFVPTIGLRIYIPGLKLRMPLLPDLNVDDLREVELPMPILTLDYLRKGEYPSWLSVNRNLGFKKWQRSGDLPPEIRRRYPDS